MTVCLPRHYFNEGTFSDNVGASLRWKCFAQKFDFYCLALFQRYVSIDSPYLRRFLSFIPKSRWRSIVQPLPLLRPSIFFSWLPIQFYVTFFFRGRHARRRNFISAESGWYALETTGNNYSPRLYIRVFDPYRPRNSVRHSNIAFYSLAFANVTFSRVTIAGFAAALKIIISIHLITCSSCLREHI